MARLDGPNLRGSRGDGEFRMLAAVAAAWSPVRTLVRGPPKAYLRRVTKGPELMGRQAYKRPWLAAMLAFLQPGLGHLYLRAWIRAVLWFVLWFGTLTVAVPSAAPGGLLAVAERTLGALSSLPPGAALALGSVTLFSTLDAYWLATRVNDRARRVEEGTADCPHCGREVDADLDFCHWCTEPIDVGVDREYGTNEESLVR